MKLLTVEDAASRWPDVAVVVSRLFIGRIPSGGADGAPSFDRAVR